jgi:hypothetical protein
LLSSKALGRRIIGSRLEQHGGLQPDAHGTPGAVARQGALPVRRRRDVGQVEEAAVLEEAAQQDVVLERFHEGIDRVRLERVDLFRDSHRAKLSANPSTHASRYEKPRSERPCFANQGDGGPAGISASALNRSSDARVCIERTTPIARPLPNCTPSRRPFRHIAVETAI